LANRTTKMAKTNPNISHNRQSRLCESTMKLYLLVEHLYSFRIIQPVKARGHERRVGGRSYAESIDILPTLKLLGFLGLSSDRRNELLSHVT
jgi:hypothetical protein